MKSGLLHRKEQKLGLVKKWCSREEVGLQREEITGWRRSLHYEELNYRLCLCSVSYGSNYF
jgi:hypothetical protein